jgi:hypothetical protein
MSTGYECSSDEEIDYTRTQADEDNDDADDDDVVFLGDIPAFDPAAIAEQDARLAQAMQDHTVARQVTIADYEDTPGDDWIRTMPPRNVWRYAYDAARDHPTFRGLFDDARSRCLKWGLPFALRFQCEKFIAGNTQFTDQIRQNAAPVTEEEYKRQENAVDGIRHITQFRDHLLDPMLHPKTERYNLRMLTPTEAEMVAMELDHVFRTVLQDVKKGRRSTKFEQVLAGDKWIPTQAEVENRIGAAVRHGCGQKRKTEDILRFKERDLDLPDGTVLIWTGFCTQGCQRVPALARLKQSCVESDGSAS